MTARKLPSTDRLFQVLDVDFETGDLRWKRRENAVFNANFAGKRAFRTQTRDGYLVGCIDYVMYMSHRVIWKMATGEDPHHVDHINGVATDNRLANLRSVTHPENMRNQRTQARSFSGISGVTMEARRGRWRATIKDAGKQRHLGYFDRKEDAIHARKQAEKEIGYHANHGRRVPS